MLIQRKITIGKLSAIIAAAAVNAAAAGENVAQNSIAVDVRRPIPVVDAKVGGFWHDEYRLLVTKWLPHCIKEMEAGGRGEELLNLVATGEVLAGKKPSVKFKGCPWSDAYPYNTLEAICLALEIDPGDSDIWAFLGNAYKESGQTEKAIETFQQILDRFPNTHRAESAEFEITMLGGTPRTGEEDEWTGEEYVETEAYYEEGTDGV